MINLGFWGKIEKPILCLAPMADVTDAAFRFIIAKYSKLSRSDLKMPQSQRSDLWNYVTYTEFVSADGLARAPKKGREKLLKDLEYSEIERPIVAQFFTSNPENMYKAAKLAVELGFDGVDINMGCPDRKVEKQGAGASLIKNPKLARELIKSAKEGIKRSDLEKNPKGLTFEIPVSVKTRLGYNKDELETWLPELLTENPAAIIVHARTRKEMSKVPARWERIKRAVEIRNQVQNFSPAQSQKNTDISLLGNSSARLSQPAQGFSETVLPKNMTLIIGNGDVENVDDAIQKCKETGADGAMLGRAVFGNPWLFSDYQPTAEEKLKVLVEHTKLFEQKFLGVKNFAVMKKHFKAYLSGIPNSKNLLLKLIEAENTGEVDKAVKNFLLYNK